MRVWLPAYDVDVDIEMHRLLRMLALVGHLMPSPESHSIVAGSSKLCAACPAVLFPPRLTLFDPALLLALVALPCLLAAKERAQGGEEGLGGAPERHGSSTQTNWISSQSKHHQTYIRIYTSQMHL